MFVLFFSEISFLHILRFSLLSTHVTHVCLSLCVHVCLSLFVHVCCVCCVCMCVCVVCVYVCVCVCVTHVCVCVCVCVCVYAWSELTRSAEGVSAFRLLRSCLYWRDIYPFVCVCVCVCLCRHSWVFIRHATKIEKALFSFRPLLLCKHHLWGGLCGSSGLCQTRNHEHSIKMDKQKLI